MSVCPRSFLLGLLIILFLQDSVVGQNMKTPEVCCFSFFTRPIPVAAITGYKETSSNCTKAGVIFTTKKGHVCADPGYEWVQRAMGIIDRRIVEGLK